MQMMTIFQGLSQKFSATKKNNPEQNGPLSGEEITVDFHSHILPRMDDGSSDPQESVRMLQESFRQGITKMVATPHFYPEREYPDNFLKRRRDSVSALVQAVDGLSAELKANLPDIYLGAEVAYFTGIGSSRAMKELSIVGTDYILVEMPFFKWDRGVIEDILDLKEKQGLNPIIAHIGRYARCVDEKTFDKLLSNDILIQSNAEFFTDRKASKKALQMLEDGRIHILGSDCHNMGERKPDLGEAMEIITGHVPASQLEAINSRGFRILETAVPCYRLS